MYYLCVWVDVCVGECVSYVDFHETYIYTSVCVCEDVS